MFKVGVEEFGDDISLIGDVPAECPELEEVTEAECFGGGRAGGG